MTEAIELTDFYPAALAKLANGELTWGKVKILLEQTTTMTDVEKTAVAERVVGRADGQTLSQFRRSVRQVVEDTDPDALRRRRTKARADRGLWVHELPDGMAEISALLPAVEAVGIYAVLDHHARQDEVRLPRR